MGVFQLIFSLKLDLFRFVEGLRWGNGSENTESIILSLFPKSINSAVTGKGNFF